MSRRFQFSLEFLNRSATPQLIAGAGAVVGLATSTVFVCGEKAALLHPWRVLVGCVIEIVGFAVLTLVIALVIDRLTRTDSRRIPWTTKAIPCGVKLLLIVIISLAAIIAFVMGTRSVAQFTGNRPENSAPDGR